jgi:hypothetical protein
VPNPVSPGPELFEKRSVVPPETKKPLAVKDIPDSVKVLVTPKSKLLPFSWKVNTTSAFAGVTKATNIPARANVIAVNL